MGEGTYKRMEGTLTGQSSDDSVRIVLLGSGNVATHLAKVLAPNIVQIWSRNPRHAETLAHDIGAEAVENINDITLEALSLIHI